ncbi:hypothetical protein GM531_13525 [Streptococcus pneumoniae]|nr:hypothetical protein [Streptococcus pneumoniae]
MNGNITKESNKQKNNKVKLDSNKRTATNPFANNYDKYPQSYNAYYQQPPQFSDHLIPS